MRLLLEQIGMKDGLLDRTEPFHVELLVQLGQLDRAREMLARLEAKARAFPRPWIEVGTATRAGDRDRRRRRRRSRDRGPALRST